LQIFVALDLAARIALSEDIELGGMLPAKSPSALAPRTSHEPGGARDHDDNNDNRLDHDWCPDHDQPLKRNSACLRQVPRLSHQNNATAAHRPPLNLLLPSRSHEVALVLRDLRLPDTTSDRQRDAFPYPEAGVDTRKKDPRSFMIFSVFTESVKL
jgi:hypothetical protein